MVHVLPHIVQVVVFPPSPNALLSVAGTTECRDLKVGVSGTEEKRLVLVHTGVGEKEGGIVVRYAGGGGPELVTAGFDKVVCDGGGVEVNDVGEAID
jgi:hypothetical protein